jgi:hypothetical protein
VLDAAGPSPVGGLSYNYNDGSVDIDAVGPSVPVGNYLVETVPTAPMELQFQFAEDVSASLSPSDIQLTNLTTNTVINPSFIVLSNYNSFTNTATFIFDPAFFRGILPDGEYEAVINAGGVTDAVGNPMVANAQFNFFFLGGDANRDMTVDTVDFNILAANFSDTGKVFTEGDFNYDGTVDTVDFNILAANFSASLPAAGRSAAPLAVSTPTIGTAAAMPLLFGGTPIKEEGGELLASSGLV